MRDDPETRLNPMLWHGEETPQGVFVGAEPALTLLGLPQGAKARHARAEAIAGAGDAARALLRQVATALEDAAHDLEGDRVFPLARLSAADRAAVLDLLGAGEVAGVVAGEAGLFQISESVFPGLWRATPEADPGADWIEIGDAPSCVRDAARAVGRDWLPLEHIVPPDGTMNVMGVLAEVRARAKAWRPGEPNAIMNFTLLPMTEADAAFLALLLGEGPVRLTSGGYGSARVIATGLKRVWAVQFLNSMGVVILDTLEIGDLPEAARAQREDFEDSARRLTQLLHGGFA